MARYTKSNTKIDPRKFLGRDSADSEQEIVNSQTQAAITRNSMALSGFSTQLENISQQVAILSESLQTVSENVISNELLRKQREEAEIRRERQLLEKNYRTEAEDRLEKKIQAALISPVKRAQAMVGSLFQRVMGFFQTLFLGWLSVKGLETIQALATGNTNRARQIIGTVGRTLINLAALLTFSKRGIGLLARTLGRVAKGTAVMVATGLTGRPIRNMLSALTGRGKGLTSKGMIIPSGRRPGSRGAGGLGTGISTAMDFFRGDWVDGLLGTATILTGGKVGIALKILYWGKQLVEMILGKDIMGPDSGSGSGSGSGSSSATTPGYTVDSDGTINIPKTIIRQRSNEEMDADKNLPQGVWRNILGITDASLNWIPGVRLDLDKRNTEGKYVIEDNPMFWSTVPEPAKTIVIDGVEKPNPDWERWKKWKDSQTDGNQSSLVIDQSKNISSRLQNMGPLDELKPIIASVPVDNNQNQRGINGGQVGSTESEPTVPSLDATNHDNFYPGFALAQANVIEALT